MGELLTEGLIERVIVSLDEANNRLRHIENVQKADGQMLHALTIKAQDAHRDLGAIDAGILTLRTEQRVRFDLLEEKLAKVPAPVPNPGTNPPDPGTPSTPTNPTGPVDSHKTFRIPTAQGILQAFDISTTFRVNDPANIRGFHVLLALAKDKAKAGEDQLASVAYSANGRIGLESNIGGPKQVARDPRRVTPADLAVGSYTVRTWRELDGTVGAELLMSDDLGRISVRQMALELPAPVSIRNELVIWLGTGLAVEQAVPEHKANLGWTYKGTTATWTVNGKVYQWTDG